MSWDYFTTLGSSEYLEGLLKHRWLDLISLVSNLISLWRGLRMFLNDVNAAGLGNTLWEPLLQT